MQIEARKLTPGWETRIVANAFILVRRNPLGNIVAYLPVVLSCCLTHSKLINGLTFALSMVAATIAAFKEDGLYRESVFGLVARLFRHPALLAVMALAWWGAVAHSVHMSGSTSTPDFVHPLGNMHTAAFNYFLVFGLAHLAFKAINLAMHGLAVIANRNTPPRLAVFGLFVDHLVYEHGMTRMDAVRMNQRAAALNRDNLHQVIFWSFFAALIVPLLFFFPSYFYCLYREIFYGPGLCEKKAVPAAAARLRLQ